MSLADSHNHNPRGFSYAKTGLPRVHAVKVKVVPAIWRVGGSRVSSGLAQRGYRHCPLSP